MKLSILATLMIFVIIVCLFSFALLGWHEYYEAQRRLDQATDKFQQTIWDLERWYKQWLPKDPIDSPTHSTVGGTY